MTKTLRFVCQYIYLICVRMISKTKQKKKIENKLLLQLDAGFIDNTF